MSVWIPEQDKCWKFRAADGFNNVGHNPRNIQHHKGDILIKCRIGKLEVSLPVVTRLRTWSKIFELKGMQVDFSKAFHHATFEDREEYQEQLQNFTDLVFVQSERCMVLH